MLRTCLLSPSVLASALVLSLAGCTAEPEVPTLFVKRTATETGIGFRNDLAESPELNILNYLYYYNGGGVAAGDFDGDGRNDLFFTANEAPNKLYRNLGGFRFEDVTESAGVAGFADWTTGVTTADVNGDGHLDLYVLATGDYLGLSGRNALYVNDGDGTFTERAAEYGLAFAGYGTQATFFDYDRDGDLDVYLLNHSTHTEDTYGRNPGDTQLFREEYHPRAGDRLYRNDDGVFVDATREAGIYGGRIGYGLGVIAADLDRDGWPDLWIGNDFHENDYLYFNNGDGTFTESIRQATGHNSRSAMGLDAADVDDDGLPDVFVLDMLPVREDVRLTAAGEDDFEIYDLKLKFGFHHQLVQNTLFRNLGGRRFAEVAGLAGVEATDWSWASLFADLDLDGDKDLFVTNGIYRRPNDGDFIETISQPANQRSLEQGMNTSNIALLDLMPQIQIPNAAFRNDGGLRFTETAAAWGLADPGFSNGAAYVDLDGDGDLDLVTNNIGAEAGVYENRADSLLGHRALTVRFEGAGMNRLGLGTTVMLWHDGRHGGHFQMQELTLTRGFQSAMAPELVFGLGDAERADSLTVIWPDGRFETHTDVPAGSLTLRQSDAAGDYAFPPTTPPDPLFEDATDALALDYRHAENVYFETTREPLIPNKASIEGPALAVADVNGDGRDDLFAGGAKRQPARLLLQNADGTFTPSQEPLWQAEYVHEDVDAAFFDADGDGDPDLYVVSGGNEFWGRNDALLDRLYLNDGGTFTRAPDALPDDDPADFANGCCVAPADYDGDGDLDLFVGSRVVARQYAQTPRSRLLENDGTGRFTDVTDTAAPALADAGRVTAAVWADVDGDGADDLVLAGEWMPIRVFSRQNGTFAEIDAGLDGTEGWWRSLLAHDLDGDGDLDLVAGNFGLNNRFDAAPDAPVRLYAIDLDANDRPDFVLTYMKDGEEVFFASVDALRKAMPSLRERYPTYGDFATVTLGDLLPRAARRQAEVLEAHTFASTVFLNDGGTFSARPLPARAQFAPVYALAADDYDGDGHTDLLLGGTFLGTLPPFGRHDADVGVLLRGDGAGGFAEVPADASGFVLTGQARAFRPLRLADGSDLLVVARNDAPLQVLRRNRPAGAWAGR